MHSQFTSIKWAKSQHKSFQMAWRASQHITLKLPKNIGPPPHRKGNSEERDTDLGFDSTMTVQSVWNLKITSAEHIWWCPMFGYVQAVQRPFKPFQAHSQRSWNFCSPTPPCAADAHCNWHNAARGRKWPAMGSFPSGQILLCSMSRRWFPYH